MGAPDAASIAARLGWACGPPWGSVTVSNLPPTYTVPSDAASARTSGLPEAAATPGLQSARAPVASNAANPPRATDPRELNRPPA